MPADDGHLARDLAVQAGGRLLTLRASGEDPDDLRKAGDRSAHEFLVSELARLRPGDAVLSEEGRDDPARLAADRVWIVDPLDGTREFGEPGRTDWAVHVALWERGELTAGAVALPARDRVLGTADPVRAGSAGAKAAAVILGEADAYLHDGGQYEWDSAAPVAVALAAGLHASRIDGSKLEYNQAEPWQPDILICPGNLADRLLVAIGAVRPAETA